MAKLTKSQSNKSNDALDAELYTPESNNPTQVFNQQNNFHLSQHIDLGKLTNLSIKSPDIANKVMELYAKQQEHNISIDNRILKLEEKEQELREMEAPHIRRFAFLTLYFGIFIGVLSLCAAVYFAYIKEPVLAGTAITIPFTMAVSSLLGKNKNKDSASKPKK